MITEELAYAIDPVPLSKDDKELHKAIITAKAAFEAAVGVCKKRQSEIAGNYEDSGKDYKAGTSAWQGHSKVLLNTSTTPASLVLLSTMDLLGPLTTTFDPDTLWLELDRLGVDMSHENRNKLLSAILLFDMPVFLWDYAVFASTISAFAGEIPDVEVTRPVSPSDLAWGVIESAFILEAMTNHGTEVDREPRVYTAACLHEAGLVTCPGILNFASEELESLTQDGTGLEPEKVRVAWKDLDKSTITTRTYSETPLDVQLGLLSVVRSNLLTHLADYTKLASSLVTLPSQP